jgi:hypothetical protein
MSLSASLSHDHVDVVLLFFVFFCFWWNLTLYHYISQHSQYFCISSVPMHLFYVIMALHICNSIYLRSSRIPLTFEQRSKRTSKKSTKKIQRKTKCTLEDVWRVFTNLSEGTLWNMLLNCCRRFRGSQESI